MARNLEREAFLSLNRWPGRLTAQEAGWALGFSRGDILELEKGGHLEPLGHPVNNSDRYYVAEQIESLRNDAEWLTKATEFIRKFWRKRNVEKPEPREDAKEAA